MFTYSSQKTANDGIHFCSCFELQEKISTLFRRTIWFSAIWEKTGFFFFMQGDSLITHCCLLLNLNYCMHSILVWSWFSQQRLIFRTCTGIAYTTCTCTECCCEQVLVLVSGTPCEGFMVLYKKEVMCETHSAGNEFSHSNNTVAVQVSQHL